MKIHYKQKYLVSVAAGLAAVVFALCGGVTQAGPTYVQVSGDLAVNLQSADLSANYTVWTNRAYFAASVGDFSGGYNIPVGPLNVATNTPLWNGAPINAILCTNDNLGDNNLGAVYGPLASALPASAEFLGDNQCSVEAWVYANDVVNDYGSGYWALNTAVGWGDQTGEGARLFAYCSLYNGAFFDWDTIYEAWNTPPTAGAWHYVVWTWSGPDQILNTYVDGVPDQVDDPLSGNNPLDTVESSIVVGGGTLGGQVCPWNGYIAAVRVMSGVLTPAQVTNNYAAGPLAVIPVYLDAPGISPTNNVFEGSAVTLSVVATNALLSFNYQWMTDNGTLTNWTAIPNATNATYAPDTSVLNGSYEYEVILTNSASAAVEVSPPATLTVSPNTAPTVVQNTTPSAITNYVNQFSTFTAVFTGRTPLNLQWQVSADDVTFTDMTGQTSTNLTVSSAVPGTNYFRLQASNILGTNNSTPAKLILLPAPPLTSVPVQVAGDLIVDLRSVDLSSNSAVWINRSISPNSVGNFTSGNALLNVPAQINTPSWFNGHLVNALWSRQSTPADSVISALSAPTELQGDSPCSVEAWIYPNSVSGNGLGGTCQINAVAGWGTDSTSTSERLFAYQNNYNGCIFSWNGNGAVYQGWPTALTPGAWHHVVWTWDGTYILNTYIDGVPQLVDWSMPSSFNTLPGSIVVAGGGTVNSCGTPNGVLPFDGYVAAARVMTGVLTPEQVTNNFVAGLFGVVPSPTLGYSYSAGSLTLTWQTGGTLMQATSLSGPWTTVTSTSPYTVNPALSGGHMFYRVSWP